MNFRKNSGITLIALVITIIVLLILAGVSLSLVVGSDGIMQKAEKAATDTKTAGIKEEVKLALAYERMVYMEQKYTGSKPEQEWKDYINGKLTSGITTSSGATLKLNGTKIEYTPKGESQPTTEIGTFDETTGEVTYIGENEKIEIPEGLEIGSVVSYTPSGTYDQWTTAHSGYDTNYNLASGSSYTEAIGQTDMTIESWKVFKIDEKTGEVELVPSAPTSNGVYLQGANGYNNSVKLLNDACSSLYGKTGVNARSINIEDIESVLDYDPKTYTGGVTYRQQYKDAYASNKTYPAIYAEEIDSIITPAPEGKNKTLGLSDAGSDWVTGTVVAETSIQPYQTYYFLSNSDFSSKLKKVNEVKYSDLLLPRDTATNYWVASRCINLGSDLCSFPVCHVSAGRLGGDGIFNSNDTTGYEVRSLFPILSLNINLLEGDTATGWSVK